jgi:hypothetical protein
VIGWLIVVAGGALGVLCGIGIARFIKAGHQEGGIRIPRPLYTLTYMWFGLVGGGIGGGAGIVAATQVGAM